MSEVKKTGLYDIHVKLGGKMVPFAGYMMPQQYSSIVEEHLAVRNSVGIFDVSHMGEITVKGPKALEMVQKITTNDVSKLEINQAQYSAMLYEHGGIVDDLIVYRRENEYLLVVNASNKDKDFEWIMKNKIDGVEITDESEDYTQIAVQGRNAEPALQKLTDVNLADIQFYWFREGKLADIPMIISRTGYTGEPGFELYFNKQYSEQVWNAVMEAAKEFDIKPCGLGARDTLRLEKKMCLYGNDIDQNTNPLEAGLKFITKLDKGDFIGREALLKVQEEGLTRKLMGFAYDNPRIPRHGYKVFKGDQEIGFVTSGMKSPILNKCIGLAYVAIEHAKLGEKIEIELRGQKIEAEIVKTPFV
ncbi:MAG: glycine cleavage system aminomethyltransferase GcvT [Calditrichia bacterium]